MKRSKTINGAINRLAAFALLALFPLAGLSAGNSVALNASGGYTILYDPNGAESVTVKLDGAVLLSAPESGAFVWQPQSKGTHRLVFSHGQTSSTNTVNVTSLPFAVQEDPNPPMPVDGRVVITPATRNVKQTGGSYTVTTLGSTAGWQAAVSDDWIHITETEGEAGLPVPYMVGMNTNAETRVGYIYVSGHVHTITQAGVGSTLDAASAQFESAGGTGSVGLSIAPRHIWSSRPNVDWISVSPTSGMSDGTVQFTVAPLYDVTTRSGTITAGGNTFSVFQYGRRMGLSPTSASCDHNAHVILVSVDALTITTWDVMPNNSWISVVDGGKGKGGDLVTLAISENPSFQPRSGTVTIGTETFRVTQEGTTDLSFEISPTETSASANGANGLVAVLATPDLPWSAVSRNDWITVVPAYSSGAGNGNVAYTAFPNTTINERTGTIVFTPDRTSGLGTFTHTVRQPAATVALSRNGCAFDAAGESATVDITVSKNVQWSIEGVESVSWLSVNGATTYVGPATVTLAAASNDSIYPRSATIQVAGRSFSVTQKGRGVELDYESKVFGTEGGWDSISVHPDGAVSWTAVSSDPTWITITAGGAGTGDGEVLYTVSDYVGEGSNRTGTITIGDKTVTIVQTAYPVSVSPVGSTVTGNAGAGEFGVSASIEAVWNAIATEPWITITSGQSGDGSGTVLFVFEENTTGKTRTGRIVVNGAEYTLTQQSRDLVAVNGEVDGHGGVVRGAGFHDRGENVSLEAVPDSGYSFLYWTLPDGRESMVNPLSVRADAPKTYLAKFAPDTPELLSVVSGTNGVALSWVNLPWALRWHVWRGSSAVPAEAVEIAILDNDGSATYLDATGDIDLAYFYWIEAEGVDDQTMSAEAKAGTHLKPVVVSPITYRNLKGATHANPATYTEETSVVFSAPTSSVEGYAFAGWEPASIGTSMKGPVTVFANWTANTCTIVYDPNGGSGTTPATVCTYDQYATLAENAFVRTNYLFRGWATTPDGAVAYAAGETVLNLSAAQNAVVTFYAVWEIDPASLVVEEPVISPADGTVFKTETCTVTITCETDGASIYYTTNGRTPTATARYLYTGPFAISGTTTITAFSAKGDYASDYVEATLTYVEPIPLTLKGVLDEAKLGTVVAGGEAPWTPVEDDTAKVGGSCAAGGALADTGETERLSTLSVKVNGPGTFSFWWRVDCEPDPRGRYTYDHVRVSYDGAVAERKDGVADWTQVSTTFTTEGEHEIVWTYVSDGYPAEGGAYAGRAWVDGVSWSGASFGNLPSVAGDDGATVSGDETSGYVVQPSAGNTAVEVTIPDGLDPAKVTVEVGTAVATVKPNGATVKVVKGSHDITPYLDIPAVNAGGVIAIGQASVKQSVADESLDASKGATFAVEDGAPVLTTAATKPGLTYTLREGATLGTLSDGATKQGDGQPWTPTITVKGGASGFYRIKVGK